MSAPHQVAGGSHHQDRLQFLARCPSRLSEPGLMESISATGSRPGSSAFSCQPNVHVVQVEQRGEPFESIRFDRIEEGGNRQ